MDINAMFSQARELARQGDRSTARHMLEEILQEAPQNEDVLLWYALLAPTRSEVVDGLQKVLEINPNNAQAQQRLAKLQGGSGVPAGTPSNSSPFAYEPVKSEEPPAASPATFTAEAAAPVYTPAASSAPSTPLETSAASPALLKRLDNLITLQEHMDQQVNKINRVAQFFFWLAIVSLVLSLISVCLALAGLLPILNSANTLLGG